MATAEKVGELTQQQLITLLGGLLDQKLDQKLANLVTKEDMEQLSAKVTSLQEENVALKKELQALKRQDKMIKEKLVDLEGRSRRNNLIFKGLRADSRTRDFRQVVRQFCIEKLDTGNVWVNRAHPLGRDPSTIIAHLPDDSEVELIMSRVKMLKGTSYVVHRDFPQEVRLKRSRLAAVRAEVERVAGRRRMPLVHDHLILDGVRFTWEDGRLLAGRQDGGDKLHQMLKHDFSDFLSGLGNEATDTTATRQSTAASPPGAAMDQEPGGSTQQRGRGGDTHASTQG